MWGSGGGFYQPTLQLGGEWKNFPDISKPHIIPITTFKSISGDIASLIIESFKLLFKKLE